MSRVAKSPIALPKSVEVTVVERQIQVKGSKGTLSQLLSYLVTVEQDAGQIRVLPVKDTPESWMQAGTARANINNMVLGVTQGFEKKLQLVGVGYKAQAKGRVISLTLGYSHPIEHQLPDEVSAETPTPTEIILKSVNKQVLGQVAANVRGYRPPEPYKGKGVKYANETILRKEAKKK